MDVPWHGWIATIGVLAWAAIVIIGAVGYARRKNRPGTSDAALQRNIEVNQEVLAKLDAIDTRLAVVEKTLTDIR